jgi:xanthine/uracil permease
MPASALYGLFVGTAFFLLNRVAPQPLGLVIWWSFWAVQLALLATACWRRTGLPFATAAMATGAVFSGLLAVLAGTARIFPDLTHGWWVVVSVGLILAPLCLAVESRVHRSEWAIWWQHMEGMTAWDIFLGRHIPPLRERRH